MSTDSRRQNWERLTELLQRCEGRRGLQGLTPVELRELSRLYRSASSDLSLARAQKRPELAAYLNQLVGRAHGQIYARRPRRAIHLNHFFGVVVPQTFKQCLPYWYVSLAILIVGSFVGYWATISNPAWAEVLVSRGMREVIEKFAQNSSTAGEYFQDTQMMLGGQGLSSFLMTNNIQVALLCFALGITCGVGTFYVLAQNALMVGAVLGLGADHGKALLLASVIAPHGFVELSAVVIAGATGLRLGYSLINPGDLLRRDALIVAAREAGVLALGTIPMLVFAGLVEGLLSPLNIGPFRSDIFRLAFGVCSAIGLYVWLFWGDRIFASNTNEAKQVIDRAG